MAFFLNLDLDTPVVTTAPPELIEGGSNVVTFTCNVSHSDTIFGYEWFFNSEPIIDQINKTYILQQPNRTNSGNYSCKATSKFFDKLSEDKIVLVRCKCFYFLFFDYTFLDNLC